MKPPLEHNSEQEFLEAIAQQYRADGYEVVVAPKSELPASLSGLHPDLLAKRGSERVVVGLKRRIANPDLKRLAEAVARESEGLITDGEYNILVEISRLRNRVAHGALEQPISREKFDTLLRFAYRLIDEPSVVAA